MSGTIEAAGLTAHHAGARHGTAVSNIKEIGIRTTTSSITEEQETSQLCHDSNARRKRPHSNFSVAVLT
jgi:hypothetical protein